MLIQLPIIDIDNPPRTLSNISEERKQRGVKALEESIKRSMKKIWTTKKKKFT